MDNQFISVKEIKENRGYLGKNIGVYKWWCKKARLECILEKLGKSFSEVENFLERKNNLYCFYVGQTKNKKGFNKRIKGQHLRSTKNSTLRRSLFALLGNEEAINDFLNVCFVSVEKLSVGEIDEKEKEQINAFLRLLNLDDLEDKFESVQNFGEIRKQIIKTLKEKRSKKVKKGDKGKT